MKKKTLKERRSAKGMTQEALAAALKIDVRTLQRMESTGKIRHCYQTDLKRILG